MQRSATRAQERPPHSPQLRPATCLCAQSRLLHLAAAKLLTNPALAPAPLQATRSYMGLTLAPFTEEETRRFLREALGAHATPGEQQDALVQLVHGKTNGLPLYVEQVGAAWCCRIHRVPPASLYKQLCAPCSKRSPNLTRFQRRCQLQQCWPG